MIKRIKKIIASTYQKLYLLRNFQDDFDRVRCENASLTLDHLRTINCIEDAGLSVFSQFDEDGIIDFILKRIGLNSGTFVEFGVDDFTESNCRFLLEARHWSGLVIEGNKKAVSRLKRRSFYWKNDLHVVETFLTANNINSIIAENCEANDIGILSVDVDGIDYYLLEKCIDFQPKIIITEYNSVLENKLPISVLYDEKFSRWNGNHSPIFYGANLKAFEFLLVSNGYSLISVNSAGNNAFFVRNDLANSGGLKPCKSDHIFKKRQFSEMKQIAGWVSDDENVDQMRDYKVMNVQSKTEIKFSDCL